MRNLLLKIFVFIMASAIIIPLVSVLLSEKSINYGGIIIDNKDRYELSRLPEDKRREFVTNRSASNFLVNTMGMICDTKRVTTELSNRFKSPSDLQEYCIQKGENKSELQNKMMRELINDDFFYCLNEATNSYHQEIKELAKFRVQKKTGVYQMTDRKTAQSILHTNNDHNLTEDYYQYLLKQEPTFFESNDFDEFNDVSFRDLSTIEYSKERQSKKHINHISNRNILEDSFDINNKFDLPYSVASFLVKKLSTNNEVLVFDCGAELCVIYIKTAKILEDDLKNEIDLITQIVFNHLKAEFQNDMAITKNYQEYMDNAQ